MKAAVPIAGPSLRHANGAPLTAAHRYGTAQHSVTMTQKRSSRGSQTPRTAAATQVPRVAAVEVATADDGEVVPHRRQELLEQGPSMVPIEGPCGQEVVSK